MTISLVKCTLCRARHKVHYVHSDFGCSRRQRTAPQTVNPPRYVHHVFDVNDVHDVGTLDGLRRPFPRRAAADDRRPTEQRHDERASPWRTGSTGLREAAAATAWTPPQIASFIAAVDVATPTRRSLSSVVSVVPAYRVLPERPDPLVADMSTTAIPNAGLSLTLLSGLKVHYARRRIMWRWLRRACNPVVSARVCSA